MKRTELNDIELNRVIGGDTIAECLRAWEEWARLPLRFTPKERMWELQLRIEHLHNKGALTEKEREKAEKTVQDIQKALPDLI